MTDDQWKSVTLGIGDGILDEGGNPYKIELSNQTDEATVQVDSFTGFNHAILRGFYHHMDTPVKLSVPAVSVETTYYVVLSYDPADRHTPVKLAVRTDLDQTGGKYHLVLSRIVRKPNQLLTDAVRRDGRQRITPVIQVDYQDQLPDAASVLWGTQGHCWREKTTFRASWGKWVPTSGNMVRPDPIGGWQQVLSTDGILVRPTSGGWECTMAGAYLRTAETYTVGSWSSIGAPIPGGYRPRTNQYTTGLYSDRVIGVAVTDSGQILISGLGSSLVVEKDFPVHFNFSWFVPVNPETSM
ncbi:hypothetical protein [Rothia koreensis]|uniref:hypothetical protein n=1 Tax=Rothia koreensis TaxID=592378 RepID=UPI003FCDC347